PLTGGKWPSVEPGTLSGRRRADLFAGWRHEGADQRLAGADQRDRHGPARAAADVVARAVDRVDQPAKPTPEPFGPIDGFFGQPPGGRQQRRQLALKEAVHFEVGRTDRAVVVFYPAFQSVAAARPLLQRNLTGLAADVFEALTVYHRMPTGSLARALQARRAVLMPAASPFSRPTPEGALHHEHPRIPGQGTAGEVRYRR